MCRVIRWIGYASTVIGAILIVMAIVGAFRLQHHCVHPHTCSTIYSPDSTMAIVKTDSGSCKQHSMNAMASMGKPDSSKCFKHKAMCCAAGPMMNNCSPMFHHIAFHIGLAICFLLLAIALFMICNSCHCRKCCECKDEKKE